MALSVPRPRGETGGVYVTYETYRGGRSRSRRWFESGLSPAAKAFYLAKAREGRRPRIVKAEDGPGVFDGPADP